ncbi:DEAD/DEAH box helicase [Rhodopila sp.]|uniref:DEAD/DEAH box helicase n=1 Tax=Rhodopila sp. TaxID=2480087 RepID=UPI003D0CF014
MTITDTRFAAQATPLRGGRQASKRATEPALFADLEPAPASRAPVVDDGEFWRRGIREALVQRSPRSLVIAEQSLRSCPLDPELLLLGALTAIASGRPERGLALLKRYAKRYVPNKESTLLSALALGAQDQYAVALAVLRAEGLESDRAALRHFVGDEVMGEWLRARLATIRLMGNAALRQPRAKIAPKPVAQNPAAKSQPARPAPSLPALPVIADLPKLEARFDMAFEIANPDAIATSAAEPGAAAFRLRGELVRLSLFEGFDELLCLPALQGVEAHWYQVETVRKVLKQYRGRVLLADEVGLGKTVEAGMVLKEYILRGMAERILFLTPASLVGQWRDEMAAKFGIACATSHDSLLRTDPAAFWAQPLVIASIASARRKEHAELLAGLDYDVVVVDQAHHLRDQSSASYQLVNRLQKRFLLLLSATPVQNSLLELYNLLTLLQPGIFKTQKEFRSVYMVPGKPREPANRERLRDLMRGVMVRNTRALPALRMPRRQASTLRAVPDPVEATCYEDLTALVREAATGGEGAHRLSLQHLLAAAGSSPAAAAAAIARFAECRPRDKRWTELQARTLAIAAGAKEAALLRLLAQNPAEKKLVFVHHRDSLTHLAERLRQQRTPFALFSGDMSGPQKDAAVEAFRDHVGILLCSESGGEGRNLQFCNTLINFDIPWNPMAIEQRIGRIDRIGQTREVFIFNLVTAGTIEDQVLRILDEKINMFELVVGEVGAILGEIDEQQDFSTLVLDAWLQGTEQGRADAFAGLESQLLAARSDYEGVKQLDEALFGNELDAA